MNSLEKAEFIILEKIHKTNPHLKYALRDMIDGVPYNVLSERYGLTLSGLRNLKCRYKDYIEDVKNG
jgi:hypothetical protein